MKSFRVLLFLALIISFSSSVFATTETVSTLDELKSAVNGSCDTIIVKNAITLTNGTVLDGKGKTIQVSQPYLNSDGSYNSNHSNYCVFTIASGADVSVSNMTIYGGHNEYKGGGITTEDGTLRVSGCTISRSSRGLYIGTRGKAVVKDSNFVRNAFIEYSEENYGKTMGGAILVCNNGLLVIDGCSLTENRCHYAGGAIGTFADGSVYANNCILSNNYARGYGGGIGSINSSGKNYVMNCTITGNFAGNFDNICDAGGGIFGQCFGNATVVDYVVNSVIAYNYSAGRITVGDYQNYDEGQRACISSDLTFRYCGATKCLAEFNNCLYGTCTLWNNLTQTTENTNYLSLVVNNSKQIDESNFSGFRNDGILYTAFETKRSSSIANYCGTTIGFKHPLLTSREDNPLGLYVPLRNLSANDGVVTYFDYSDLTNIKMSYGTDNKALTGLNAVTDTANYKVKTYFEGIERNTTIVGASASVNDLYYTVKLGSEPNYGIVSGITLYGDGYKKNTKITIEAFANNDCDFVAWKDSNNNVVSTEEVYSFDVTQNLTLTADFSEGHHHKIKYEAKDDLIYATMNCHSGCSFGSLAPDSIDRVFNIEMKSNLKEVETQIFPNNATNKDLRWISSDTKYVVVDEHGIIHGVKETSTPIKIYAYSTDGSNRSYFIYVNIVK